MKILTEREYINIKVRISNLINLFTTGRIRKKDMPLYNKHLNYVVDFIEDTIESKHDKANCFVAHIDNHLVEMAQKGEIPMDSKVMCKICNKDIDLIYDDECLKELDKKTTSGCDD